MAIEYFDECCGCAVPGYPCLGSSCPNRNVPHHVCDECGEDNETIYEYEGEELCLDCVVKRLTKVE